jgi:hypothetical protein
MGWQNARDLVPDVEHARRVALSRPDLGDAGPLDVELVHGGAHTLGLGSCNGRFGGERLQHGLLPRVCEPEDNDRQRGGSPGKHQRGNLRPAAAVAGRPGEPEHRTERIAGTVALRLDERKVADIQA